MGNPKTCPKCGSEELNFLPWLGMIYECCECGWRGPLVIERERKREKKKGRK